MVADVNTRIDQAALTVQSLPPVQRALLGREQLIVSQVLGREIGPREQRLMRLLKWSGRLGILPISLLLLLRRVWVQRKLPKNLPKQAALFIGIGALRETTLRQNLRDRLGHDHVFLDQRQMDCFAPVGRLRLGAALKEWSQLVPTVLKCARGMTDYDVLELRATLAMRLPDVAQLLAQFRSLKASNPGILIACSTSELPAHVACILRLSVEYHQHGFLARTIVFPNFTVMHALTNVEGQHVAARIPNLKVNFPLEQIQESSCGQVLALAGTYGENDPRPVTELVRYAVDRNYQVVIRPHPMGDDVLWSRVRDLHGVIFDTEGNFNEFLTKWQPAFLATWFSTTLLDGLLNGAIPITLSAGRSNLVFPFDKISLAWPHDCEWLARCMADEQQRCQILQGFTKVIS